MSILEVYVEEPCCNYQLYVLARREKWNCPRLYYGMEGNPESGYETSGAKKTSGESEVDKQAM